MAQSRTGARAYQPALAGAGEQATTASAFDDFDLKADARVIWRADEPLFAPPAETADDPPAGAAADAESPAPAIDAESEGATAEPRPPAGEGATTFTAAAVAPAAAAAAVALVQSPACARNITADVVAFDQVIVYNRFGAFNPAGMMYALRRDVVPINSGQGLVAGNVQLRPDKRPRPLVLRVNEGDCLTVTFTNLLTDDRDDIDDINFTNQPNKQPYTNEPVRLRPEDSTFTRHASMHVNGLEYVDYIGADGSNVGNNGSTLAASGDTKVYKWYARKQGQYLIHSMGAVAGGEGDGGQVDLGLFGAVVVEPPGAKWYRSQVTAAQLTAVKTGQNPNGTPKINYEAVDGTGTPILKMLSASNEIIHSDVNALITGFTENCATAPPSSTCGQPFREFVVVFHDEIKTVQAFPELEQDLFHGVRDGFAINYGSGSMGAIVLANRRLVGPSRNCPECKFEDFFLTSWANGDPAMVIRRDQYNNPVEVLFPDDPSNVHHSYLGDPVRFRNLHAGPKETHVFHLHAHQWLHESREDGSTYLDSQTISPGSTFTYEINYGGSGNRNFTVGDAIFHCHLYPHFAQGMWELWRVHDVFEDGTPGMNERACAQQPSQVPCTNSNANGRNLPDGEIAAGTPNPAIVPLPTKAMPPMPSAGFRGYPFFLASDAGHRPPQPPLDFAPDTVNGGNLDGGLQRHKVLSGQVTDGPGAIEPGLLSDPVAARVLSLNSDPNLLAFARRLDKANLKLLNPLGEPEEQAAMNFHHNPTGAAVTTPYGWPARGYASYKPDGTAGQFLVNGRPRIAGAPFAEPCKPNVPLRNYRAAYLQIDMVVNRAGWHDRQARITVLEGDVAATRSGARPPEPFFIRANSNDCVVYNATNLVPSVLNLDDFQIFTPTDTIGQHIHLVKFDVTSSDGASNGFNYEDGTFSPDEVRERIEANNAFQHDINGSQILTPKTQTVFGPGPNNKWVGAQTTIQRWWADPLVNRQGIDRTIQTVFTHDHFSPSSHQHHGMYGALVVEPSDSSWQALDGTALGTRASDGGPTSYAANIVFDEPDSLTGDLQPSYREFNLAFADFALLYTPAPELRPINPPGRKEVGLPHIVEPPDIPQPESISADDPGSELINYRQEPIPLRVGQNNGSGQFVQKTGAAGDMANVFSTATHGDPFTPLLQVYEGDKVKVRLIQGAQEEQHAFTVHGAKWLHEHFVPDSGYYNAQAIGISEHFEFYLPPIPAVGNIRGGNPDVADFLYGSGATDNLWNGMWGILREYRGVRPGLQPLPYNLQGTVSSSDPGLRSDFCPSGSPQKHLKVDAWLARDLVGANGIKYNNRFNLRDPAGIVFIQSDDEAAVRAGTKKIEPLVLRANANDCINIRLRNFLPETMPDYDAWNFMPMLFPRFNLNQLRPSNQVSLHPQLVEFDVRTSDGANIGINDRQTAAPGETVHYRWYAGRVDVAPNGVRTAQPIEYGITNLTDYGDIMKHGSHGAIGSLVIEPAGSTWTTPTNTYAEAEVKNSSGTLLFKEFVLTYQDDLNMVGPSSNEGTTILGLTGVNPVRNYIGEEDPEDSGMKGFNYRTEPLWARLGFLQEMTKRNHNTFLDVPKLVGDVEQKNVFSSQDSNVGCGGACGDPETPLFSVAVGTRVRFRVNQPTGHARQHGFTIYGHNWFHEPFVANSTTLWRPGVDPELNSMTIGTQGGQTARRHWNIILRSAGGGFAKPGDYMYRTQESYQLTNGLWGIFRVTPQ